MKGLKKLTLASAIVAAPFASQAMEALDDATMGDVTGQAGVTIVTDADMTIGSVTYTDEGSVTISDISVSDADDSAVGITQTIDVTNAGLSIGISAIEDLKATIGSVAIGGAGATSLGAIRVDADIAAQTQTIASGGATGAGLDITQTMQITDLDVLYVDGEFTETAGEVTGSQELTGDTNGGAAVFIDSISTSALTMSQTIDVEDYTATSDTGSVSTGDVVGALAIRAGAITGTVNIAGIKFLNSTQASAAAADTSGNISANAAVSGAASIGSIAISGIDMAGTTTYIYAH